MAFSGWEAGVVLRSALGVIGSALGILSENAITRQVMARVTTFGARTYQEYQGVVRRALGLSHAGSLVTTGGAVPLGGRAHPIDPSIQPADPRYRYRVRVTIMDDTGATLDTVGTIDSDAPMSHAQLTALIAQDIEAGVSPRTSERRSVAQMVNPQAVDVLVISAGRRQ